MHTRGWGARLEASVAVDAAAAIRPKRRIRARGKRRHHDPDLGWIGDDCRPTWVLGRAERLCRRRTISWVGASVPTARVPEAGMEANDTLVQASDPNLLCPICINVLDNPLRTPCG